jgi:hypothetical protein
MTQRMKVEVQNELVRGRKLSSVIILVQNLSTAFQSAINVTDSAQITF